MMGNYVGFLITSLLLISCMVPSEQTDRPPQRTNDENHVRPAVRGRPPRSARGSPMTEEMSRNLVRLYYRSRPDEQAHRHRFHAVCAAAYPQLSNISELALYRRVRSLIDRGVVEIRNEDRQPEIIWNPRLESQLLELYRHNPEINREPLRLYRHWRRMHPTLPDIGPRRLYSKALRLHDLPAHRVGGQNQEPDVISIDDSAPNTPRSETGSEIEWEHVHVSHSDLPTTSGYESEGAESSSSVPSYPDSSLGPR